MPVSYPACIEIAFLHSHPKSADTFQINRVQTVYAYLLREQIYSQECESALQLLKVIR